MRIAFLQSSLWLSGGAMVVAEYANRLSQRGHSVSIVIPQDTISSELQSLLSSYVRLIQANYPLTKPISMLGKIRLTWEMARAAPSCDILVSTHTPTTLVAWIAAKWMRKGKPVWFYMDYPGMFEDRPEEAWLLRNAMRWHEGALVLSSHSAEELQKFSKKRIRIVGLGISHAEVLRDALPTRDARKPQERKAILYLGDFRPRKGLQDFIDAAQQVYLQYPDIEVWLALKEQGEVHCNVPFQTFYRPSVEKLAELYATCDLFVSSSWFEGFGLPPLEAMACGAPVVMTDSGGVRDYAKPGENCLLVPIRAPEKIAQAMLTVLTNPDLAEQFSQKGPVTAADYTWDQAAKRFEDALVSFL